MGFFMAAFYKSLCMEPLAHQPALHINKAGKDGIN
jgi:hypothetical protein